MDLIKLLSDLIAEVGTDKAKAKTVIDTLRKDAHQTIFQPISNVGFAAGKTEGERSAGEATTRLAELETRVQTLVGENDELKKKQPDLATIRETHANQIRELEAKSRQTLKEEREKRDAAFQERDLSDFAVRLTTVASKQFGELDPDYVEIQKERFKSRLKYENGNRVVVQEDGKTPVVVGDGENVFDVLAKGIAEKAPAVAYLSRVKQGPPGELRDTNTGTPKGGNLYDSVRAEVGEKNKAATAANGAGIRTRLGREPVAGQ